jgi:hypothetical protein
MALPTCDPDARRAVSMALRFEYRQLAEAWGARWQQDRLDACEVAALAILVALEDQGYQLVKR